MRHSSTELRVIALFLLGSICACAPEQPAQSIGGSSSEDCEEAWDHSRAEGSDKDTFMGRCMSSRWVAICTDGTSDIADTASAICRSNGGVAEWIRQPDG